jgi:hypothetical protein
MRVTYLSQALGTGGMGKGGLEMPPYGYSDGCLTDSNGIKQEGGYDG